MLPGHFSPHLLSTVLLLACLSAEPAKPPSTKEPGEVRLEPIDARSLFTESEKWESILSSISSCPEPGSVSCPRFYTDPSRELVFVEVCKPSPEIPAGLHVYRSDSSHRSYEWWDQKFSSWSCENGCNDRKCVYRVTRQDAQAWPSEVVYEWDILLSFGHYKLSFAGGKAVVVGSCSEDLPS